MMQYLRNLLGWNKELFEEVSRYGAIDKHVISRENVRLAGQLFREVTVHQQNVQAKAVRHLVEHGSITQWDIQQLGTTSASKLVSRLKDKGIISGSVWEKNRHGNGEHKRYFANQLWLGEVR